MKEIISFFIIKVFIYNTTLIKKLYEHIDCYQQLGYTAIIDDVNQQKTTSIKPTPLKVGGTLYEVFGVFTKKITAK